MGKLWKEVKSALGTATPLVIAILGLSACRGAQRIALPALTLAQQNAWTVAVYTSGDSAGHLPLRLVIEDIIMDVGGNDITLLSPDGMGPEKRTTSSLHYQTRGVHEPEINRLSETLPAHAKHHPIDLVLRAEILKTREVLYPKAASRFALRITAYRHHKEIAEAYADITGKQLQRICDFSCARRAAAETALRQLL